MSSGYHTAWRIPEGNREDPAYVEAGAAIALGQAVYDRRITLGLDCATVAGRAGLSVTDVERIEGGATAPTLPLLRALALALDARIGLFLEGDETHLEFTAHAA